jgi:hypothetical protein
VLLRAGGETPEGAQPLHPVSPLVAAPFSNAPQIVRFVGACCDLPDGLTSAMRARAGARPGQQPSIPPSLVQGVKLAIVMEL